MQGEDTDPWKSRSRHCRETNGKQNGDNRRISPKSSRKTLHRIRIVKDTSRLCSNRGFALLVVRPPVMIVLLLLHASSRQLQAPGVKGPDVHRFQLVRPSSHQDTLHRLLPRLYLAPIYSAVQISESHLYDHPKLFLVVIYHCNRTVHSKTCKVAVSRFLERCRLMWCPSL